MPLVGLLESLNESIVSLCIPTAQMIYKPGNLLTIGLCLEIERLTCKIVSGTQQKGFDIIYSSIAFVLQNTWKTWKFVAIQLTVFIDVLLYSPFPQGDKYAAIDSKIHISPKYRIKATSYCYYLLTFRSFVSTAVITSLDTRHVQNISDI